MVQTEETTQRTEFDPVRFRGMEWRAFKHFAGGTQRVVAPAETLERIRKHFHKFGLTRLANITGLDRIGIPVVLAIRPSTTTLAVDAGKGFDLVDAKVSAAMESLERSVAETFVPESIRSSYQGLPFEEAAYRYEDLPLTRNSLFSPYKLEDWTKGTNLIDGRDYFVPAAMVNLSGPQPGVGTSFQKTSNGLASGNHFLEALCAGIYEVVERDAITLWSLASPDFLGLKRVLIESIDLPLVNELVQQLHRAGVRTLIFDCRVDTGIPVFIALVYDVEQRNVGMFKGYGCHLDPQIALVRAITEAVQARVVIIAGSRDDILRSTYRRLKQTDVRQSIAALESIPETVDVSEIPGLSASTFEGDVWLLTRHLTEVGIEKVIIFDLDARELEASVVRVVIPGLEGYRAENFAPGPRGLAFAEAMVR